MKNGLKSIFRDFEVCDFIPMGLCWECPGNEMGMRVAREKGIPGMIFLLIDAAPEGKIWIFWNVFMESGKVNMKRIFPGQIWKWDWESKTVESPEFRTLRTFKLFPGNWEKTVLGMFWEQKKSIKK